MADGPTRAARPPQPRDPSLVPAMLQGPLRAGALLCLSGGIYAVALAGVAAAQQATDDATQAAQQPALDAIAVLRSTADRLAADITSLDELHASSTTSYATTTDRIGALEADLAQLADRVSAVSGVAARLPDRLALPSIPRSAPAAPPPRTHVTTRASGG